MSRAYTFAVDCYPVNSEQLAKFIANSLEQEMCCTVEYWVGATEHEEGTTAYFESHDARLCGGETDDEAHERLVSMLKKEFPSLQSAETKWLCEEWREWDATYTWDKEDDD